MENNQLADKCLMHRYLYYVLCEPIISDMQYDIMEKKAKETCDAEHLINKPGSSLKSSYSEDIIKQAKELLNGE